MPTLIEQLAAFSTDTRFDDIPAAVVHEAKRLVLDSLGCALAAVDNPKGRIGIDYGRLLGGSADATIIGTQDRVSVFGAAFANGELINALDMDAVVAPGHVTPYVLPGALALAEARHASGRALLRAVAVAHEMSWRMGKAMDYLRDTAGGQMSPPPVYGYSSTIFGATAAIAMLQGQGRAQMVESLGIAGLIPPAQSMQGFFQHAPSTTIKYLMAGALVQAAMTAAHMGLMGHRGDAQILDDAELGFARYIGTRRWEPQHITAGLGTHWGFISQQMYKPYPHCRILHGPLDCLRAIVAEHDLQPGEIEGIRVWVEAFVEKPVWLTREVRHVHDAQFSIAHGMAMGAHRLPPGKDWLDPANVFSDSVMGLMHKVRIALHPDYVQAITANPSARPTRVEVQARGRTFSAESLYPRGTPSDDPATQLSDAEIVAKFRHNASGVIADAAADAVVQAAFALDGVPDAAPLMRLVARTPLKRAA
ncbi:MmgE/PrpD family protein [Pseudorhodoferax sp.]|uniref:MmgE/PrpD family protein n=1 Tax=Pseudorhodoferax sp. TaxID=1993553 RepID=UPI002DD6724B|nr:MmgE/PrpD family protein [Pseudorhodoferax sp.]